jgi:agmatine deiminase
VNGAGTLLTTKSCLLNPNRNPNSRKKRSSSICGLSERLEYPWLGDGIEGDDTEGHVDDLTRFVARTTVVTVVEEDSEDPNYQPLQENLELLRTMDAEDGTPLEVVTLPMPHKITREGQRLPASYANFYIGNKVVLLPVFADTHDKWAIAVLERRSRSGGSCRSIAGS